jgi:hypothetical protein
LALAFGRLEILDRKNWTVGGSGVGNLPTGRISTDYNSTALKTMQRSP